MARIQRSFDIDNLSAIKKLARHWCDFHHDTVVWLDSNNYPDPYGRHDTVLAFDAENQLVSSTKGSFEQLQKYIDQTNDWLFGYLTYDLKNDLEALQSVHKDKIGCPELFFFQPRKIIFFEETKLTFSYLDNFSKNIESDWEAIRTFIIQIPQQKSEISIQSRMTKEEYLSQIHKMKEHISRGNIYEANFCQEFYSEKTYINPIFTYDKLNDISLPPFAVYLKNYPLHLLSASPERYLLHENGKAISQPIKGTARRSENVIEDESIRLQLTQNEKERTENIMIVDLVRNDMSHFAERGSVTVDELCEAYTFRQVHQLISTVSAQVRDGIHPVELIKATFPMGSMTGAPKVSAMQIIDELEYSRRGLYSGAVGYFSPEGNFDFNVVIRSIIYNAENQYVSYSVGSAITAQSDLEAEYNECLLKANAMRSVLENTLLK